MKRLLGVCVSLVLMSSSVYSDNGVQLSADQVEQLQAYVASKQEAMEIGFQADFESGGAMVCGTLVAVKNDDAAGIDMDAVLLDGIRILAAAIDPAHAAQMFLKLYKQIFDSINQSMPALFANYADQGEGVLMAQVMKSMNEAVNNQYLEAGVLYHAMGSDVTQAVQHALQAYVQMAFPLMQQRLEALDEKYASVASSEDDQASEEEAALTEDIKAEAVCIIQDCLNGMLPAMADCLEQHFPIDRKALGL